MKEVAILLLAALLLNGCSTSTTTAQTAASGVWNAELLGGSGEASGLSFTTQFTVSSNNSLNITFFQLLTQGSCFAVTGGTQTGTMTLTTNSTTMAVTGPFSYTEQSQGNTLTLTGAVTGTESGTTLSGGSITGTWAVTGGTGCNASNGTFTMKQTS
jgi:hypothetical protein